MPHKLIGQNVRRILTLVGLGDKEQAFPKELSGGEQQRVALARALVNKPAMLLADEPTGNLDPKTSMEIMQLLEAINQQGTTVIVVTHDNEIVNQMRARSIKMKKMEVMQKVFLFSRIAYFQKWEDKCSVWDVGV